MSTIVPACGRQPSDVLVIGESPGKMEAHIGRPFVGPSGEEQERYLNRHGLTTKTWRLTNVIPEFTDADPTPTQIRHWTPHLISEIHATNPRLIIAVGRLALKWLLGEPAELELCQGLPHRAGAFDPTRRNRAPQECLIVPVTHPAAGFHSPEARAVIWYGYSAAAQVYKDIMAGRPPLPPTDQLAGATSYKDVTGSQLAKILREAETTTCGIDTETDGRDGYPWSVQISVRNGEGYILRVAQPDFAVGAAAIQGYVDRGQVVVLHNAFFDIATCRLMGIELRHCQIWDSQYAAYLLDTEPQGLKPLAYRWLGVRMTSYQETVGKAGTARQLQYLWDVMQLTEKWAKPEPRLRDTNDGSLKVYKPKSIYSRAEAIYLDGACVRGTNVYNRWRDVDEELRLPVEQELARILQHPDSKGQALGPMLPSGLPDVPLQVAIDYAVRDADVTRRLYLPLMAELERRDLAGLMTEGMEVLPVFEEMQATGMPASRRAFQQLYDDMTTGMEKLQREISRKYYDGKPFNPRSSSQTAEILRRKGLEPGERTKTGKMSTSKKSIEHLRKTDGAIAAIMDWREYQHTRDMFATPTLALMPPNVDIYTVRCQLLTTRTTTRRLASKEPNLLAMPKHSKYGSRVRDCYIAPDGEVFLECDLSQIEMRMMAHESNDPVLVRIYHDPDADLHTETAAKIFGVQPADVTKHQRFMAKSVNFGIPYGISDYGLEAQMRTKGIPGMDANACGKLKRDWYKLYKGCDQYFRRVEAETVRTGEVRDCWGMPRSLPGVWVSDPKIAAEAKRHAVNHKIQGGAQGLLQRSMAWLAPRVRQMQEQGVGVKWLLQVHDALLLQVPEPHVEEVTQLVVEGMTRHCGMVLRVPVLADSKTAKKWGGL